MHPLSHVAGDTRQSFPRRTKIIIAAISLPYIVACCFHKVNHLVLFLFQLQSWKTHEPIIGGATVATKTSAVVGRVTRQAV